MQDMSRSLSAEHAQGEHGAAEEEVVVAGNNLRSIARFCQAGVLHRTGIRDVGPAASSSSKIDPDRRHI